MSADAVELRGVAHRFGGRAVLEAIDLRLQQGSFNSVIGQSGCGKSTLLRVLAGLLVPSAGDATIAGRSVVGRPGEVAYMPQRDLLLPWRRALGNAVLGSDVQHVPREHAEARALELFERFGLAGFERAWPAQLSGGMRQRLALLRTFLQEHEVLLLDEPFGALDALTRQEMQQWLQQVWQADRRTVLLVTHDIEEALTLSDRVVVLSPRPGRVVAELDVDLDRPRSVETVTDERFIALKTKLLDALHAA
ncbi:MAG: ABC transporter ATP-binding protein [Egibacteraceae bacterium]